MSNDEGMGISNRGLLSMYIYNKWVVHTVQIFEYAYGFSLSSWCSLCS